MKPQYYYSLIPLLDQTMHFHSKIKRSNPTYYKARVLELLEQLVKTVPSDVPQEFCENIGLALYLHKEVMAKGYCACRTHWLAVETHLKRAKFLLTGWLEAQKVNPQTSPMERVMLEQQKLMASEEDNVHAILNSPTASAKRSMTVSGVTEQDITAKAEFIRKSNEDLARIYGRPIPTKTEEEIIAEDAIQKFKQDADSCGANDLLGPDFGGD